MWPATAVTQMLNLQLPIIQAPMAGFASPELVATVSNTGALGSFAAGYMTPDEIKIAIQKIRSLTTKSFAVNLFITEKTKVSSKQLSTATRLLEKIATTLNIQIDLSTTLSFPSYEQQLEVLIEENVPIFSFTFGIPEKKYLEKLKKNKVCLIGTATNLPEAQLLEEKGVDLITAQGIEAGGHRGSFLEHEPNTIGLMALLPQLADKLKTPFIAAGGIMDARGIAASLILGASGVQMGTAFLACKESSIHPKYKKLLLNASHDVTVLTRSFSGKTARGINNKFIEEMETYQNTILPYPYQHLLTTQIRKLAKQHSNTDFMSMWAGQGIALSQERTAAELIKQLDQSVRNILKK